MPTAWLTGDYSVANEREAHCAQHLLNLSKSYRENCVENDEDRGRNLEEIVKSWAMVSASVKTLVCTTKKSQVSLKIQPLARKEKFAAFEEIEVLQVVKLNRHETPLIDCCWNPKDIRFRESFHLTPLIHRCMDFFYTVISMAIAGRFQFRHESLC